MFAEATLLRARDGAETLVLRSQVGISGPDPEKRTGWMHVAPFGEWKGHDSGEFTVTGDVLASAISTFDSQANPIAVDYGHASVFAFEAPAAGYVQALEQRDDGLWAQVEWTERAAAAIRGGEYRFCSAVFLWNQKHRQSGEKVLCQLHSIALTNVPFIDGQQPIALSRRIAATNTPKVTRLTMDAIAKDEILKAIKALDGEEVTAAQIASLVEGIAKIKAAQSGEAKEEKPEEPKEAEATPASATPAATAASGTAGALPAEPANAATTPAADAPPPDAAAAILAKLEELAAKAGTDVAGLLGQIEQMLAPAAEAPSAMSSTLTARLEAQGIALRTLTARVREFEADAAKRAKAEQERVAAEAEAKIQTALTTALKDGRILEADRARWEKLARADLATFTELTASLPKAVPTGKEAASTAGVTSALPADGKSPVVLNEADPKVVALRQRAERVKGIGPGPAQDAFVRDHLPFM